MSPSTNSLPLFDIYMFRLYTMNLRLEHRKRILAVLSHLLGRTVPETEVLTHETMKPLMMWVVAFQHPDTMNTPEDALRFRAIESELRDLDDPYSRSEAVERWLAELGIGKDTMIEVEPFDRKVYAEAFAPPGPNDIIVDDDAQKD